MIFFKCSAQRTNAFPPLVVSVLAAFALSACGGQNSQTMPQSDSTSQSVRPNGAAAPSNPAYGIVHNFGANPDGKRPSASLTYMNGTLYSTTYYGGIATTDCGNGGCGTVFSVTPTGGEAVLHAFQGGESSARPLTDLLAMNGTLYGTAVGTGSKNGIVFKVSTSGKFVILHHFGQGTDGNDPSSGLIDVNGTLYGVTAQGGNSNGSGTVYSITPSGNETVLHRFALTTSDGCGPGGDLIDVGGTLYGAASGCGAHEQGVVYSITPSGNERVLYNFGDSPNDGKFPNGPLLYVNGALYGTTNGGGSTNCQDGCGTVFRLTLNGVESVLYNFSAKGDGSMPSGGLVDDFGTLYGTTALGGANSLGTIFSLTLGGTETVLHNFGIGSDGYYPSAALLKVNGTLYGTAYYGGANKYGAVFSFTP